MVQEGFNKLVYNTAKCHAITCRYATYSIQDVPKVAFEKNIEKNIRKGAKERKEVVKTEEKNEEGRERLKRGNAKRKKSGGENIF